MKESDEKNIVVDLGKDILATNGTSKDSMPLPSDLIDNPIAQQTLKLMKGHEINQHNLEKLWRVAPFLNSTLGTVYQPFKGHWKTESEP